MPRWPQRKEQQRAAAAEESESDSESPVPKRRRGSATSAKALKSPTTTTARRSLRGEDPIAAADVFVTNSREVTLQTLLAAKLVVAGDRSFKLHYAAVDGKKSRSAHITKDAWLSDSYDTFPTVAAWVVNILAKRGARPKFDEAQAWGLVTLGNHNLADIADCYASFMETHPKPPASIFGLMRGRKSSPKAAELKQQAIDIRAKFLEKKRLLKALRKERRSVGEGADDDDDDDDEEESSSQSEGEEEEEEEEEDDEDEEVDDKASKGVEEMEEEKPLVPSPAPAPRKRNVVGFVDPDGPQRECPVCFFELENPVKLECSHLVCRSCAAKLVRLALALKTAPACCVSAAPPQQESDASLLSVRCPLCGKASEVPVDRASDPFPSVPPRAKEEEEEEEEEGAPRPAPKCKIHGKELTRFDVLLQRLLCSDCESKGQSVYGIFDIAAISRDSLGALRERSDASAASFIESAERLESASTEMDSTLESTLAQITRDAEALREMVNKRQRDLTERCSALVHEKQALLRGQASLLRSCSDASRDDAATINAVLGSAEGRPFRLLRVLPVMQHVVAEHIAQTVNRDPCCSIAVRYEGLQDGDVAGLPLWGRLRDVEVSLAKSEVFARLSTELKQGKRCTAYVAIARLHNAEGELVSFERDLLGSFETYVVFGGERQPLLSRTPWAVRQKKSRREFGPLAVSYSRTIEFRLSNVGEYSIIIGLGEAQKKTVCSFTVSASKKRRKATAK